MTRLIITLGLLWRSRGFGSRVAIGKSQAAVAMVIPVNIDMVPKTREKDRRLGRLDPRVGMEQAT